MISDSDERHITDGACCNRPHQVSQEKHPINSLYKYLCFGRKGKHPYEYSLVNLKITYLWYKNVFYCYPIIIPFKI